MPPLIWEVIVTKIKRTSPRVLLYLCHLHWSSTFRIKLEPSLHHIFVSNSYYLFSLRKFSIGMLSIVVIPLISMSVNEDIVYYASIFVFVPQILDNFAFNLRYQWNPWIIFCLALPKFLFTVFFPRKISKTYFVSIDLYQRRWTKLI